LDIFLEEDFATESDLLIACIILKKYIKYIDGEEDNIIIPKMWMTKWKETSRKYLHQQIDL
jgi:hypothetical protein